MQLLYVSNTFYDSEGTATGTHSFKFPSWPAKINRWCNLIKRQNNKDGFTPKQERKLSVRQQITVKSTPKKTQKTSLSITLLNYEEPMTKDVGTQTNNTLFELLDHDYSLYHTDYSKNNNFGIENTGLFNTDPRVK